MLVTSAFRALLGLFTLSFILVGFVVFDGRTAAAQSRTQTLEPVLDSDGPVFSFLYRDGQPVFSTQQDSQLLAQSAAEQPPVTQSQRIYLPIISQQLNGGERTFISHTAPVYVADIDGRVYTAGLLPPNRAIVHTAELGENGSDPATWPVGNFTGFYPAVAAQLSQRSLNLDVYGDSAVQMQGFITGFHLRSRSPSPDFPWQLGQYYYGFEPKIYPWEYGPYARFCIDLDAAVPMSESEGDSINYAYTAFKAIDRLSGEIVWISMSQYDERQELIDRGDIVHWWSEAGDPIALGVYGGNLYSSLLPGSSTSTSETWDEWRQFGYCISFNQMQMILRDINNLFDLGISEFPENYGIELFGVGPEMYIAEGHQSTMSMRVRNVSAFTLNSQENDVIWDRSEIRSAETLGALNHKPR